MQGEPQGCLFAIFRLFGLGSGAAGSGGAELPYRMRDDFLSAAEISLYQVLIRAVGEQATVLAKVNLADVFFVVHPNENQGYRNKIDRKHVDFLLCDPATMQPRCGIELDDSSHSRSDRRQRDDFVDQVFETAGLPLVRIPAKSAYVPSEIAGLVTPYLTEDRHRERPARRPAAQDDTPVCPKCGVPMVSRQARKGPQAGQSFYGCPNYPRCREVVAE